jgi:hypothetical protein
MKQTADALQVMCQRLNFPSPSTFPSCCIETNLSTIHVASRKSFENGHPDSALAIFSDLSGHAVRATVQPVVGHRNDLLLGRAQVGLVVKDFGSRSIGFQ